MEYLHLRKFNKDYYPVTNNYCILKDCYIGITKFDASKKTIELKFDVLDSDSNKIDGVKATFVLTEFARMINLTKNAEPKKA